MGELERICIGSDTHDQGEDMKKKSTKKEKKSETQVRKLQIEICFTFVGIVIAATAILALVILQKSSQVIKREVSGLVSANSHQLELNINSYLEKVENTVALLFEEEAYYSYDATTSKLDEFEKIRIEDSIEDRIEDLGLIENFADFGIVYRNDHTVGWISDTTISMFQESGMFQKLTSYITEEKTKSGWFSVFMEGKYNRIYYVKEFNENALLVAAFYNRELASVFEYPEELKDMTIRLVDNSNVIVYSNKIEEIGSDMPQKIHRIIGEQSSVSVMAEQYLVTANLCENNWRVVCSIPTSVILQEIEELRRFIYLFTVVVVAMVLVCGLFIVKRITSPVDGMVSELQKKAEIDRLSGLLNKLSFQEMASAILQQEESDAVYVMVILDMDNFKQINDHLGHAYGDQVIVRLGQMLKLMFGDQVLAGRIGGDEFALFMHYVQAKNDVVEKRICSDMQILLEMFSKEFEREQKQYKVSLSAGVAIEENKAGSPLFEALYSKADQALYVSKRSGKNQYTLYQKGIGGEQDGK